VKNIVYFIAASGFTEEECERRAVRMQRLLPPGFTLAVRTQPSGLATLDPPDYAQRVLRGTATDIGRFRPPDVDAVVLGVALDLGLREAREAAVLPVIGPGEASLFVAAAVGRPLSVIAVDDMTAEVGRTFVREVPAKPTVVSVRSMKTPLDVVTRDPEAARDALRRECRRAVEDDGATAIYLGAMTLSTLDAAAGLRREFGVTVFDPLPIALATAVACIEAAA
jgi:allantoin racemase